MLDPETKKLFEAELPPLVPRTEVEKLTGGLVRSRYLEKLDAEGRGPKNRLRLGRKIVYRRPDFIAWLSEQIDTERLGYG